MENKYYSAKFMYVFYMHQRPAVEVALDHEACSQDMGRHWASTGVDKMGQRWTADLKDTSEGAKLQNGQDIPHHHHGSQYYSLDLENTTSVL